jgi:prophage maintenance system killer protein
MKKQAGIEIYRSPDDNVQVEVQVSEDTVWLNRHQLAFLFDRDIKTVGKHIGNVFKEKELEHASTGAKFATVQKEGNRLVERQVEHYNLDVIISVGYRVKSKRGTQFRIWATKVLKEKLLRSIAPKGTEKQLAQVVKYIGRITTGKTLEKEETVGLLQVITEYERALDLLDQYDHQQLQVTGKPRKSRKITVQDVRKLVASMKAKFGGSKLFGAEKDGSLESSIETIYQTFEGKDLYATPEIKAANLLYFMVKNHSFTDGNKRIAAATFIMFLHKNSLLLDEAGNKIIDNNTLVALTLLIAESDPKDRDMLVKVTVNLIQKS